MKIRYCVIFIFLSGCGWVNTSNIAPGYVEAFKSIAYLLQEKTNPNITREVVNAIPYASSVLTIGKGTPGLIILSELRDSNETWISADGVYIVITNGKIIKTSGLLNNLTRSTLPEISFGNMSKGQIYNYSYYLSYENPDLNDLKLEVTMEKKDKEEISILGVKRDLILIEETLRNTFLGWTVKNSYWVDQDGFVWKSIQNFSPKLPPFKIEVTKKPAL